MASRTATLCMLLVLLLALRGILHVLEDPLRIPESWLQPTIRADAETLLAFGARVPLACADMADLELISGVSDSLAAELLDKREQIIAYARDHSPHEALQLAHGIGARTAATLSAFLALDDSCHQGNTYEPFQEPH